jgi:hypothetical protein
MNPRSQQTVPDSEVFTETEENEATLMEGLTDTDNGGEIEEAAKGGKESKVDVIKLHATNSGKLR